MFLRARDVKKALQRQVYAQEHAFPAYERGTHTQDDYNAHHKEKRIQHVAIPEELCADTHTRDARKYTIPITSFAGFERENAWPASYVHARLALPSVQGGGRRRQISN